MGMKKVVCLFGALASSTLVFAQGVVSFQNTSGTRFFTNSFIGSPGYMSGINAYRIGLYTAPDGTVNESFFTLIAVATNSALLPGRFGGGMVEVPGGTPIAYQIRAWSLYAGISYEHALATALFDPFVVFGKSPIGRVTSAMGPAPAPNLFGPGLGNAPDFPGQLNDGIFIGAPIPEPSSYVLAALGLLLFRLCRWR